MTLRFVIPGRAKSVANLREHHFAKAKRVKAERAKAMMLCPKWPGPPLLTVTFWRFGVRALDSDNLASSMKSFRDGIASRLQVDDGSPLVLWQYGQTTCPPGREHVEVTIAPYVDQRGTGVVFIPEPTYTTLVRIRDATPTPSLIHPKEKP